MSFFGLSPLVFALGLVGIGLALGVLHLLRVRLRRVTVDTLLFWKLAGTVQQPRTLLGKPARWLAFLLALVTAALLWTAYADPVQSRGAAARALVVDTSGAAAGTTADGAPRLAALLAEAARLAADGQLGPRGVVISAGTEPAVLWRADEPLGLLAWRAEELIPSGPGTHLMRALQLARAALREGDEILLLGGPAELPSHCGGVRVIRLPQPSGASVGFARVAIDEGVERRLTVEACGAASGDRVELWSGGERRGDEAVTPGPGGTSQVTFGALPATTAELELRLVGAAAKPRATLALTLAARRPRRVVIASDVPEAVRIAVAADPLLAADTGAPTAATELAVQREGQKLTGACLEIGGGGETRLRTPRLTEHCPLELSLRDRRRPGGSLLPVAGERVWIEDQDSGEPLLAADVVRDGSGVHARIRVVEWLLDEPAHRDVPALVVGALRWLAGLPDTLHPALGESVDLALPIDGATDVTVADAAFCALPQHGALPVVPTAAGAHEVRGANAVRRAVAWPSVAPWQASAPPAAPVELAALGGAGRLLPWLLCGALALLLVDALLYHRGRLP